jgi:hypothetical protein
LAYSLRFQLAAFRVPFADCCATVAHFGQEAGFTTASQLDPSDELRLQGVLFGGDLIMRKEFG